MAKRYEPVAFARHRVCLHFLGSLAGDRTVSSYKDSRSGPPNGASRSWAAAMAPAACVSGHPQARGEKSPGRLRRTNGTRAFSFPVPRPLVDERGLRILLLREDLQILVWVSVHRPLPRRRRFLKARRDSLGRLGTS